jgi:uncharacterized membrane protein YhhN
LSGPVVAALVAATLVAIVDWVAVARDDRRTERIAKPGVIALLIAAVLVSGAAGSTAGSTIAWTAEPIGWLLLAALAASLAGDWLLLPPVRFVGGLVAFLVAHLAYLALFLLGELNARFALVGVVMALALLVTLGRSILAGARRTGMGGPVIAYFGAIFLMAIAATASGSPLATAGAWLFVASDAMLGCDRFAAPPPVTQGAAAHRRIAVVVPYHVAQVLLTLAVLGSSIS